MKVKFVLIMTLMVFFTSTGCVVIREMLPQSPDPSNSPYDIVAYGDRGSNGLLSDDKIGIEYFYVKGFDEKHTPPNVVPAPGFADFLMKKNGTVDLNRSAVVRFFNKEKKPARIIIMVPGIYSGAGTIVNLAKSVVRRNADTEAWVWERRSNQIEDRFDIIRSLEEKDASILVAKLEKDKFKLKKNSFYQPSLEEISFMGYWGLNVQLGDLLNIVKEARTRSPEVIISGYSLGVLYVTMFLADNFGTAEKPEGGYTFVDRAILLDGPPRITAYVGNETVYDSGIYITPAGGYIDGRKNLESGKAYPCNGPGNKDMSVFYLMNVSANLSIIDPHGLSNEPYSAGTGKIPITNLARNFIGSDDNYAFFKLFTATLGRADAKHSGRFDYKDMVRITGLNEGSGRIDWIPSVKFKGEEFNDNDSFLWASSNVLFDMPEWYQPTRILLDIGSINDNDTSKGWTSKYFKLTENKKINIPVLCLGLTRGLCPKRSIFTDYEKTISSKTFDIYMIDRLTHLDGDGMSDGFERQFVADMMVDWYMGMKVLK
jgi:hypothetical protein